MTSVANRLPTRDLAGGMGQAVAERTVLRKKPDGSYETWGDVAHRVAEGNTLLVASATRNRRHEQYLLEKHLAQASLLMSGRHLQHGDAEQPNRNMEVFTNCSTAPASFLSFQLLLNGSGVGRCYDDDMMVVNWDNAPNLRLVISSTHGDFVWGADEDVRDAKHKYRGDSVVWHEVDDSREGWAKALEVYELMAYERIHRDSTLVLDFSKVRPKGAPIKGMQNRPSSGPKPLMHALSKVATIKGAGMPMWQQAMYVDHYLAECVLVGGARRAARMATKSWRDKGALDFVRVKRPIEYDGMTMREVIAFKDATVAAGGSVPFSYLWSSNNSITVDAEFWGAVQKAETGAKLNKTEKHAVAVFNAVAECAYGDGTGEPGFINVDQLRQNDDGWDFVEGGDYVGGKKYTVEDETKLMLAKLAKLAKKKPYHMIVNPCGEIALSLIGGYCVIADVVPFHAQSLDDAEEAFRVATRALIRTNTMDSIYQKEVRRTNRIGVGITGIHEYAWKFFQIGFKDIVNPQFTGICETPWHDSPNPRIRAAAFWLSLARFHRAVEEEAISYSKELGVAVPHTMTTIKPAGTTSKLFGLTEGWHLPAMRFYLRWVQFRHDDPLVQTYRDAGYPIRELTTYHGTVIVGFPTAPVISTLGMDSALVTAIEATPAEQYEWLRLGEKFWIKGTDEDCNPLHPEGQDYGNQISYTLKYDPKVVDFDHFRRMLLEHQTTVRCCSVLPVEDTSAYEYLPEQQINKVEYEALIRAVQDAVREDVAFEHVDCASGACPVDFSAGDKA